ncbi:MAG: AbrB/MazE/SpoVT family DNA-binding domain-containing protein [Candidatus Brocadiales bacterium]|nr:AbrB/MazE/SpoVT family DNA-binding domain-containing protein [Candidatus Brocadiales bacterium]
MSNKLEKIVKPLPKGQITIPKEIRKKLRITKNTHLKLVLEENSFRGIPVKVVEKKTKTKKTRPTMKERLEAVRDITHLRVKMPHTYKELKTILAETHQPSV